ncbi:MULTISPECIES: DHA2 family efflux MFS transporter permease subunit [Nocardiopsis]|uniref:DHA2 family efflux MFS transporter permease subunit n=1 Tax=Nocardiopsis TaxID=2013 RepID=UPI000344E0FB|nr:MULTISPECIES: DHA2 family efflux MFS transporter permease subunit [Nocardiopsis]PWV52771.1 EmrB/QacA subfamily drug resistance transporter [Nocardiopsis sp. L17-MgMaSL7]
MAKHDPHSSAVSADPPKPPGPGPSAPHRLDRPLIKLAAVLLVGSMAALLDTTIVNVAVDHLSRELDAPVSTAQWVASAYLFSTAAVIPVTGWAIDRYGQRATWITALVLFGVGSLLCSAAWSIESLIVFRVFTGLGSGMVLPLVMTILVQAAGPQRLGRAIGLISVPIQLAPALGPVLGGIVLDTLGWRWIFVISVPFILLAIALAVRGVPRGTPRATERLDVVGLLLLSPGIATLLYGLSVLGSSRPAPLFAGVGLLLIVGFVVHALRERPGGPPPVIDLRLFRNLLFRLGALLMFVFGICVWAGMFLLPLFFQQVQGTSAMTAGLLMAPMAAGVALVNLFMGSVTDNVGPRYLVVGGLFVGAAATAPFVLAGPDTSPALLAAAMFVRGLGLGAAMVPMLATAYRGLPSDRVPRASSALNVTQRLGAAIGTAVLALLLASLLADTARPETAFQATFAWMTGLTAAAMVPAMFLPSTRPDLTPGRTGPDGQTPPSSAP